jgi:hypothetical protein
MRVKHGRSPLPKVPKELLLEAISLSTLWWIDEKGTADNPGLWQRRPSKLTFDEAYDIINNHKPHWLASFRNQSAIFDNHEDYWDIGGCNIGSNNYGEVFIWIQVPPKEAEELFKKWNMEIDWYGFEPSSNF